MMVSRADNMRADFFSRAGTPAKNPLQKLRVLHVVPTFFPATYWGGPIFSVLALCEALARTGSVDLKVLTTDAAGPDRQQQLTMQENPRLFPEGFEVNYCRRIWGRSVSTELLRRLAPMVNHADVIHLTGIYSFPTIPTLVAARIYRKPVVWSPRGALQRWEGSSTLLLKRIWELSCNTMARLPLALHVTSEMEAEESAGRIKKSIVQLVSNGVAVPVTLPARTWRPGGALRIMFLGRIDRKKGIENLIRAVAELRKVSPELAICGSGDPAYVASLQRLAGALGLEHRVRFMGHLEGISKRDAFMAADLCVVPSFSENFANAVAEALAHGVPVIASRATPWSAVERKGCGWWVPNDPQALSRAIECAAEADLESMGRNGRRWMISDFSWDAVAGEMMRVYEGLVATASEKFGGGVVR